MVNHPEIQEIELICVIANYGLSKKVIKSAKHHGILGETVTMGRGTINNKILDFIGLSDVRKEIIYIMADRVTTLEVLDTLNDEFEFDKPNHGIAYTTSVCSTIGSSAYKCDNIKNERGAQETMYHVITIIVEKGKAEDVIDAATKAGSKGGTIINARGSGIHETSRLFALDIEPEKEIVIILSETDQTDKITASIRTNLKIDEPGNGIIYVQDVNRTCGIYK